MAAGGFACAGVLHARDKPAAGALRLDAKFNWAARQIARFRILIGQLRNRQCHAQCGGILIAERADYRLVVFEFHRDWRFIGGIEAVAGDRLLRGVPLRYWSVMSDKFSEPSGFRIGVSSR